MICRIGEEKYQRIVSDQEKKSKTRFIGQKALENRSILSIAPLYQEDFYAQPDRLAEFIQHVYKNELDVNPKDVRRRIIIIITFIYLL